MRVGILSSILGRRRTGIDNYLYSIIEEMIKAGHEQDIYLVHYDKSDLDIYNQVNDTVIKIPSFKLIKHLGVVKAIKDEKLDVFHLPWHWYSQISPFFLNSGVKKVVTVHDIIPILFHKDFNFPFVLKLFGPSLKLIKNRTDCIICDSEHTKRDCIDYLKLHEEKFRVIHLAADERFKVVGNKTAIRDELEKKYKILDPFVLYTGNVELRKNIPLIVKAFYKLKKRGIPHKLVFVGKQSHDLTEFMKMLKKLGLTDEVIFTGYIPTDDLVKFYNTAELFVYPSFYEGFGLTPLEAMACGCPVVTSNTSSLPEVVGDAGAVLDPNDDDVWADEMYRILTNESLKAELGNKSFERSKLFSWEKAAKETWKVYEDVYNNEI